jgi:hypothetical protein
MRRLAADWMKLAKAKTDLDTTSLIKTKANLSPAIAGSQAAQ